MISLGKKSIVAVSWSICHQIVSQILTILIGIVLARLLTPEDYGLLGVLTVFFALSSLIGDGGFATALLRQEKISEAELSTVFYYNIVTMLSCYIILFVSAPLVADFYDKPILSSLLRFTALSLPLAGLSAVPSVILQHRLDHKSLAVISLSVSVISAAIAIGMAYNGFGVWALATNYIATGILRIFFFNIISPWWPRYGFQVKIFRGFLKFSGVIFFCGVINTLFENIYNVAIGKFFQFSQLGYYSKASSYGSLWGKTVGGTCGSVFFPAFSQMQSDLPRLKQNFRKSLIILIVLVAFPSVVLIVIAEPLVILLLTEKWVPIVPLLKILALTGIFYPIHILNCQLLMVLNRPKWLLGTDILKKVLIAINILLTFRLGLLAMVWGQLIYSIIFIFINCYYTRKLLNYGAIQQLRDILPSLSISAVAGMVAVLCLTRLGGDFLIVDILLGGGVATCVFLILSRLLHPEYVCVCVQMLFQYYPRSRSIITALGLRDK